MVSYISYGPYVSYGPYIKLQYTKGESKYYNTQRVN